MHVLVPKPLQLWMTCIGITTLRVFQTRKGRCNSFNRRIVLSENRFRFRGRCASDCRCHDATSPDELTLLAYLNISIRLNTSAPMPS
ncbi:hypothetical protein GFM13_32200 [Rhizobium leguminosarum bv. viciae]|nr:hypothetical protein [Rhizobium leguminosarum bv. viciae]